VIRDTLEMRGEHDIELFFHCHEECEVRQEGSRLRIARGRDAVTLSLPEGGQVRVLRGSMAPIGGWVSRAFDRKQPAPTILWRARLSGNAVLRSEIACG